MSQQSFQVAFFTIGEFDTLSSDDVVRSAFIDVPADCLPIAASLQSARQWLVQQHASIDMECSAELPLRAYFTLKVCTSTKASTWKVRSWWRWMRVLWCARSWTTACMSKAI